MKIEDAIEWVQDVSELKAASMGKTEARYAVAILAELDRLRCWAHREMRDNHNAQERAEKAEDNARRVSSTWRTQEGTTAALKQEREDRRLAVEAERDLWKARHKCAEDLLAAVTGERDALKKEKCRCGCNGCMAHHNEEDDWNGNL